VRAARRELHHKPRDFTPRGQAPLVVESEVRAGQHTTVPNLA
jgi:hypothetical protein